MRRKKSYVCCPACGNVISKSSVTDSEFKCAKCGQTVVAIVEDGLVMVYESEEKTKTNEMAERMHLYHEKLKVKQE